MSTAAGPGGRCLAGASSNYDVRVRSRLEDIIETPTAREARAVENERRVRIRARGNDRDRVVVRRRPEDDRAFGVVGVDVLGARARRAQSF